eukprot:8683945-Ditylum_brightwellii.AAC.1
MHNICPSTCGVCTDHPLSSVLYYLFHYPIARLPKIIRDAVDFFRTYILDLEDVITYRKNAAFAFFIGGLIFSLNLLDLKARAQQGVDDVGLFLIKSVLIALLISSCIAWYWVMSIPADPSTWLFAFQNDYKQILNFHQDTLVFFLVVGAMLYQIIPLIYWAATNQPQDYRSNQTRTAIVALVTAAILITLTGIVLYVFMFEPNRAKRWNHVFRFRKNAAAAIVLVGVICGAILNLVGPMLLILRELVIQ